MFHCRQTSEQEWMSSSMHAGQSPCTLQKTLLLHMHERGQGTIRKGGLAEVHRKLRLLCP